MGTNYAGPKLPQTQIIPVDEYVELALADQVAAVPLSGYNAVYPTGSGWVLADASAVGTAPRSVGMVKNQGVNSGDANLAVWVQGVISNSAWTLASGQKVFLASGTGSQVTTTPPAQSGAVVLVVGQARAPTVLDLRVGEPSQITQ